MSDSYQPIYDAARSRIGGCDSGSIIERVVREAFDISWTKDRMSGAVDTWQYEVTRPFVLLRPSMKLDGDSWCALYGENLMEGVAGFGKSPAEAAAAFDVAWHKKIGGAA